MNQDKIKVVDIQDKIHKKQDDNSEIEISSEKENESQKISLNSDQSDDSSSESVTSNESDIEKLDISKLDLIKQQNNSDNESINSSDNSSDTESYKDDNSEKSGTSGSTCEILSKDPLFMVLTEFLMSKNGENICDILDKINNNLKKLIKNT